MLDLEFLVLFLKKKKKKKKEQHYLVGGVYVHEFIEEFYWE